MNVGAGDCLAEIQYSTLNLFIICTAREAEHDREKAMNSLSGTPCAEMMPIDTAVCAGN
jgi:hypothetical protein